MIGRCVGGHWPPLRLGNVQMVDKRCAEVAPQGTLSCPSGNSPCAAPSVELPLCVAAKYLTLRIGKEMGAHCAPLR